MRWPIVLLLAASGAWAQSGSVPATPSNPLVASSKVFYTNAKQDILRSADKLPEDKYAFKPTDSVRTFGQLLAHVADGRDVDQRAAPDLLDLRDGLAKVAPAVEPGGGGAAGKRDEKNVEQTAKTKADIVAALKMAFAYCDAIYAGMTDAQATEMIPGFGGAKLSRLSLLDFNVAHTMEHYGNLVTYMRIEGVVPPSSEPRK